MPREKGFTLITLLFLLGLAVIVAMLAFKIAPAYMDYFAIRKSLENVLADPDVGQSSEALRESLARRLDVNFITDVDSRDMEIDKEDGTLTLMVPINRKEHLFGGVSVCIDLEATASAPLKQ